MVVELEDSCSLLLPSQTAAIAKPKAKETKPRFTEEENPNPEEFRT